MNNNGVREEKSGVHLRKPARYLIIQLTTPGEPQRYYVYAYTEESAKAIFEKVRPGVRFTCKLDNEEWKTSLFEGRRAPGA